MFFPLLQSTRPNFLLASTLSLLISSGPSLQGQSPRMVEKTVEDFSGKLWQGSRYSLAPGTISLVPDRPPTKASGFSMEVRVPYTGQGTFEHFTAEPSAPLYIPGDVQQITLQVKRADPRLPIKMSFVDGWGRTSVDKKELTWEMKLEPRADWQTVSFQVPPEWIRPVGIKGISSHNFSLRSEKVELTYVIGNIEAETDVAEVDHATGISRTWKPDPNPVDPTKAFKAPPATMLLSVTLATNEQANIFSTGAPAFTLRIVSWRPDALEGKASFHVTDQDGTAVQAWEESVQLDGPLTREYPLKVSRYGLYHVAARLDWSDASKTEKRLTLAKVPVLPEPTEAEKLASPYGINYHGGAERLFAAFKKAGFYWYRDYAFQLEWLRRAKGSDRTYRGWPNYRAILADYEQLGLICLPSLFTVEPPVVVEGKVVKLGPDRTWVRDMADILLSFPEIRYWELGNEYDLKHAPEERLVEWKNYNLYHQKFGELVHLLGDGQLTAVEQGRAGIYPVFIEEAVKDGSFDQIEVVNSHHYTGAEPPETNIENFNSGERLPEGRRPGSFYDSLHAAKQAALVDGEVRQHWLTEFGWDTLAGPVVTPLQQAAYLQRGFLLAFAAGTDKAFWFYNFDADETKASRFFDGCGLLTHGFEPKLAFAAMAGLSSILPHPKYVGSINVGPNTAGYIFRNGEKLVAGVWLISGENPKTVSFQAEILHDYLGNKLEGLSAPLQITPVFATGLKTTDPLYAQTAYSILSNHAIFASPDDLVEVTARVSNNSAEPIIGNATIIPPKGWLPVEAETSFSLAPGSTRELPLKFKVPANCDLTQSQVCVEFREGTQLVKSMPLTIQVQTPFALDSSPLEGSPGLATVQLQIENRSAQTQEGRITFSLPTTWKANVPEIAVVGLKSGERRSYPVELTWGTDFSPGESATATFHSAKDVSIQVPLIPNRLSLPRASELKIDGNLQDWPQKNNLPDWMLGSTRSAANARLWLAWAPEGIYGAVEVKNSRGQVSKPREFWTGDALELYLSTDPAKKTNAFERGDHQFWFVPDFDGKRVYVGQWKSKNEIPETRYDIGEVKGFAKRTNEGYVMEFLLPASAIQQYAPTSGSELGLNANLTVSGLDGAREVFWPRKKDFNVRTLPLSWGRVRLTD